jgi:hypothetical protein
MTKACGVLILKKEDKMKIIKANSVWFFWHTMTGRSQIFINKKAIKFCLSFEARSP